MWRSTTMPRFYMVGCFSLQIRNKLNEQQNSKLNKHREMLNQRKEEISKMDNRIHELQERLKKKRAQQAEQRKNLDNKKLDANHNPRPSNVAQVEPYIQLRKSPDAIHNEADLKSNFAKQDRSFRPFCDPSLDAGELCPLPPCRISSWTFIVGPLARPWFCALFANTEEL